MIKHFISVLVIVVICAAFAGCDLESSVSTAESPTPTPVNWEEMERVEICLAHFEDEFHADWKAFYEKYENKILVVKGSVFDNSLKSPIKYLNVFQGLASEKRGAFLKMVFDPEDMTEELLNLPWRDQVVIEGTLQPPRNNKIRPIWTDVTLEHCKLIEATERVNPLFINYDITPAFEETKAELLNKYSFVTNIEFTIERFGDNYYGSDDIKFITDVKPGTDPQEVLEYADYGIRLLNENARKIDESIAPSTGDSYGGLYKYNYISVWVRPEGVVEAHNKYYIFDVISARIGEQIELQKMYQ